MPSVQRLKLRLQLHKQPIKRLQEKKQQRQMNVGMKDRAEDLVRKKAKDSGKKSMDPRTRSRESRDSVV